MPSFNTTFTINAIVPAAGVGKRMQADCPKQYLLLNGKTILEHTINKLLSHPVIEQVVVAISDTDEYFCQLDIAHHPRVKCVAGGQERSDSVLSGLAYLAQQTDTNPWVLVHDAARPCITHQDISQLISQLELHAVGGILAAPVRDTMKRSSVLQHIDHTVDRENLWHALTPQMFRLQDLHQALQQALDNQQTITDEASAMELLGLSPQLVLGRSDNIKITQPEDLALAAFYLQQQERLQQSQEGNR